MLRKSYGNHYMPINPAFYYVLYISKLLISFHFHASFSSIKRTSKLRSALHVSLDCFHPNIRSITAFISGHLQAWTDLWGEGADQEVSLRQEVDVQDDSSQRVLGVAVVKPCRPRDGVITDELIVGIPGRDNKAGVTTRETVKVYRKLWLKTYSQIPTGQTYNGH